MDMKSSSSNTQSMASSTPKGRSSKKVRKPYTITKSRENWTEEQHDKFLEALQLFDRDWKKIEDYVGSKTVIQIRSHAQKYFLKVQKNGAIAHVPPPRPKRKASHADPPKATKNALMPLQAPLAASPSTLSCLFPGDSSWDGISMIMNTASNGNMLSQEEYTNLQTVKADIALEGVAMTGNNIFNETGSSSKTLRTCDVPKQGSLLHGIPDFAQVYSFIGSVFDPDTKGHLQKLKEMEPINIETVMLMMRNLTINLSNPDFEPVKKILASYDVNAKTEGAVGAVATNQNEDLLKQ